MLFGLAPLLSRQLTQLIQQLPSILAAGQQALMKLPDHYPEIVSSEQIQDMVGALRSDVGALGQKMVS